MSLIAAGRRGSRSPGDLRAASRAAPPSSRNVTGAAAIRSCRSRSPEVVGAGFVGRCGRRPRKRWAPTSIGLRNLNLYGLKGVCATPTTPRAGYRTDDRCGHRERFLAFLGAGPDLCGRAAGPRPGRWARQLPVMAMLDAANTGSFGSRCPPGPVTPVAGKAIWSPATTCTTSRSWGHRGHRHQRLHPRRLLPAHGYRS